MKCKQRASVAAFLTKLKASNVSSNSKWVGDVMESKADSSSARETPVLEDKEQAASGGVTREDEAGDVAEPDAPTAAEENAGMSTVLDANPFSGVQDNASEE
jgi:hypothetical protein